MEEMNSAGHSLTKELFTLLVRLDKVIRCQQSPRHTTGDNTQNTGLTINQLTLNLLLRYHR